MKVSHIGLCIDDLDRSLAFYCGVLGFTQTLRKRLSDPVTAQVNELSEVDLEFAFVEKDGLVIELLHYRQSTNSEQGVPRSDLSRKELPRKPRPMYKPGFTHLSMRVENVERSLAELEAKGIVPLKGSRVSHQDLGLELVFIGDPDGNRIELVSSL